MISHDHSSGPGGTGLDVRPVAEWYLHPTVAAMIFAHFVTSNFEPYALIPNSSGLTSTSQRVLSAVTDSTVKDKEAYMRKTIARTASSSLCSSCSRRAL